MIFLLICFFLVGTVSGDVNPFSKIQVKSQSAVFKRCKDSDLFCLQYKTNVHVTFADNTTMTAQSLRVFVKTKHFKKLEDSSESHVEKVVLQDCVKVNRKNQTVSADKVEILMANKRCYLEGNITVVQRKDGQKGIPVTAKCQKATLHWDDEELTLSGSAHKPVCTTIELHGNVNLWKKKDKA